MKTRDSRRRSVLQIIYAMNKLFMRTCAGREIERERERWIERKKNT